MSDIVTYHEMAWQLVDEVYTRVGVCPVNTTVDGLDRAICPIHITWELANEADGRDLYATLQDVLTSDRWHLGKGFREARRDGGTYMFRVMCGPVMAVVLCPADKTGAMA